MRLLLFSLVAMLIAGCAGPDRHGYSYTDPYDSVRVDQMTGNHVSGRVLERTLVCLNARRETRLVTSVTNQIVEFLTNVVVISVTNLTVTFTTNSSRTLATNLIPALRPGPAPEAAESGDTNTVVAAAPPALPTTNVTVTTGGNTTLSRTPQQTVSTATLQTVSSRQVTVSTNNLAITTADNLAISAETNQVVTLITNLTVATLTNTVVLATNLWVRDHFLAVEFTPPPDFNLVSGGESLVLLVDGQRHGLATATPQAAWVARRGFQSAIYRASPELIVDLANAREVKLRLRGTGAVIEKSLSRASLESFREFVKTRFVPPPDEVTHRAEAPMAALGEIQR